VSALAPILRAQIAATGPMSLADYMSACLLHPEHGYYSTRPSIGADGDFITAPEISQMFGELAGLALAQAWADQGAPAPVVLAELGPGRGTLMADALRATARVPGFAAARHVHLVEASARLRAAQARALGGQVAAWHRDVAELPEAPLLLIANEFFDALPVRQFQRTPTGWRERLVGLAGGRLAFGLGPEADQPALAHRLADTRPGEVVEHCPGLAAVVAGIGARIAVHGGCALIIDYGAERGVGDSFQALRGGRPADPLEEPGLADLTAHVDFAEIARAAAQIPGLRASVSVPQGPWLERLGITARARTLATGLAGEALESHIAAHRRLTHPEEMGNLFRVIALIPAEAPEPPGLDHGR